MADDDAGAASVFVGVVVVAFCHQLTGSSFGDAGAGAVARVSEGQISTTPIAAN